MDCFATSTPWEYELFKTDHAVSPTDSDDAALHVIDPDELENYWPDPLADADLDGWLAAGTKPMEREL